MVRLVLGARERWVWQVLQVTLTRLLLERKGGDAGLSLQLTLYLPTTAWLHSTNRSVVLLAMTRSAGSGTRAWLALAGKPAA